MSSGSDDFLRAYATADFEVLVAKAAPPESTTGKRTFSEAAQEDQKHEDRKAQKVVQEMQQSDTEDSDVDSGPPVSAAVAPDLEQIRARLLQKLDASPTTEEAVADATQARQSMTEEEKVAELQDLKMKVKKLRNANRGGRNKVYYEVLKKLGPSAAASFWVPAPTASTSASTASSTLPPFKASTPPFKAPPPEPMPPQLVVPPPPPADIYRPIDWTQSAWWHDSSSWQSGERWWP